MRKQLFSIHLFMLNRIGPPPHLSLEIPCVYRVSGDEWLKSTLHHPSIMQGINGSRLPNRVSGTLYGSYVRANHFVFDEIRRNCFCVIC